jgi:hypothetical protein
MQIRTGSEVFKCTYIEASTYAQTRHVQTHGWRGFLLRIGATGYGAGLATFDGTFGTVTPSAATYSGLGLAVNCYYHRITLALVFVNHNLQLAVK